MGWGAEGGGDRGREETSGPLIPLPWTSIREALPWILSLKAPQTLYVNDVNLYDSHFANKEIMS